MTATPSPRLHSLDILRGLIILTMLFVNDVAGVHGVPWWMSHAPTRGGYMTFVDLVFPAFLFMVGMALPFALGRRLAKGEPARKLWGHITLRTFSLVVLGLFMVIGEGYKGGQGLPPSLWTLLGYAGVILVWNTYSAWQEKHPKRILAFRAAGVVLILTALWLYQGDSGSGFKALQPGWWGILGIIGWAYLAGCAIYVPGRRHPEMLLGGAALLFCLHMASQTGCVAQGLGRLTSLVGTFAPHGALVLLGAMLGGILQSDPGQGSVASRVRWSLVFAGALYLGSVLLHGLAPLHEMFIISKNLATPAWCLRSAAYTTLLWLAIYLLVDVRGLRKGSTFLAEAGGNALFAYILAPIVIALVDALGLVTGGWSYGDLGANFSLGLIRSIAAAFALTWLAGFLKRKGLQLKL